MSLFLTCSIIKKDKKQIVVLNKRFIIIAARHLINYDSGEMKRFDNYNLQHETQESGLFLLILL